MVRCVPRPEERTAKCGIKNKRLTAGWNETYLQKALLGT